MKVVGIDPSTKTGFVCLDGDTVLAAQVIQYKERAGFHRVQSIAACVVGLVREFQPDHVMVEGYVLGGKKSSPVLFEVAVSIRLHLHMAGILWWDVAPTTLKKLTTGSGNAKKPDMAHHVKLRWGFDSKSDDVVDAYALARVPLQKPNFGVNSGFAGIVCSG